LVCESGAKKVTEDGKLTQPNRAHLVVEEYGGTPQEGNHLQ